MLTWAFHLTRRCFKCRRYYEGALAPQPRDFPHGARPGRDSARAEPQGDGVFEGPDHY